MSSKGEEAVGKRLKKGCLNRNAWPTDDEDSCKSRIRDEAK